MGEQEPDVVAFTRNSTNFHCAKLVELPIGEYDFSLVRHFLYDYADAVKFDMLSKSIFEPLAQVCRKFRGELKYHTMHANIWIKDLTNGNEESKKRMQDSLNLAYPIAYSLFETNEYEAELKEAGIFAGESEQKKIWKKEVDAVILESGLTIPMVKNEEDHHGGRVGNHTEHLQPLLDEMTEVFQIDPTADW